MNQYNQNDLARWDDVDRQADRVKAEIWHNKAAAILAGVR